MVRFASNPEHGLRLMLEAYALVLAFDSDEETGR